MEIRCSTDFGIRKCNKYLGTFQLLIGSLYCKSCGKSNHYELITEKGMQKLKQI